jgi:16S rRNA (guanine527-N7)-methyltransferase
MTQMQDEAARFQRDYDVSRETIERLQVYADLIGKWNRHINLVSRASLPMLWTRHFRDSAQLLDHCPKAASRWVDLGSGGGFPGAVIAILAKELKPDLSVTCVESDGRKAEFLRAVSRETNAAFDVVTERAETLVPQNADVVSARALAPLKELLGLAVRHLAPEGRALFPKGAKYREELQEALVSWAFQSDEYTSKTNGDAVILSLGDIRRV